MEGVTLDTFINFLVLCESNGYIELKLTLEELRKQLQSILDNANSTSDNSPPPAACGDERASPNESTGSQSSSINFSDIKTPDLISTPLSSTDQRSTIHPDHEASVGVASSENKRCLTSDSILEESLSSCLESELNFDATPSKSSLDIHFSAIETPEIFSITDAADTNFCESRSDNDDADDELEKRKSFEISEITSVPIAAADEHNDSTDCIDLHDSSSSDDDADDKLEQLFSNMKLQSAKKKSATKHISSRKSLSVFVVSDSEDVGVISSDDEENLPAIHFTSPAGPKPPTSLYQTPCTPASGIMFWGSPTTGSSKVRTTVSKKHKRPPLGVLNFYGSPSVLSMSTPKGKPTRPPPSLTTPSASKNFSRFKAAMIEELYSQFNKTIFDNKLPVDMKIIWNKKLRTTAGYCCYLGALGDRSARIELSTKVVDSYDRIRDTLVHEMCHAATWIVDGIKGGGHGNQWRAWAEKANEVYPDLKPITRCHSYVIQYKYNYKCTTCDFTTGRHSKSVNLVRARCPYCLSTLELVPRLKVDGTPVAERKLNRYAQFVKDHYGEVKSGSPWRNHKDVMDKLKDLYHQKPTL